MDNKEKLAAYVEKHLPQWAAAVRESARSGGVVLFDKDAFVSTYSQEESKLIGAAISYAVLKNAKAVTIIIQSPDSP